MRPFFVALQFLTRLPVPSSGPVQSQEWSRAAVCFPLVGVVLGGLLAAGDWVARQGWGLPAASALVLVTSLALTGALHLDGLMDTCDGLFGPGDRKRRLEIMRDSRVGAFGVLGAVSVLLLKYSLLLELSGDWRWRVILLMPVLGRWMMVYALAFCPPAREEGLGYTLATATQGKHWAGASVVALAATWTLFPAEKALLLLGGAWVGGMLVSRFLQAALGGLTGDTYGALNELVEVATLALAVWG
ncbi:MAG TPA: adenosylcobinamide-GDP ribazoletransferase [Armatimonadetes bacterium]|nr:adenosylcobinamide-GDP ribazoletransferase [Armatimonadota bacterium]